MNTTTAAAKAHRTVATIRSWCRRGVIAAHKVAGRWTIDETSLDYRLSLDPTPKPVVYSVDTMTAIGGSRWTKYGKDRVYLDDWTQYIGLDVDHYKTGNISGATLDGEHISNSEARRIVGTVHKVYFDTADSKLHIQWGYDSPRQLTRGELAARIFTGIRAAITAL